MVLTRDSWSEQEGYKNRDRRKESREGKGEKGSKARKEREGKGAVKKGSCFRIILFPG